MTVYSPRQFSALRLPETASSHPVLPLTAPLHRAGLANCRGESVGIEAFWNRVRALAEQLPERRYVFNLCEDRFLFCLSFAAALARGQVTLLPPDRSDWTLRNLAADFPDAVCLTDDDRSDLAGLELFKVDPYEIQPSIRTDNLDLPADRTAVIAFTSGSTGKPQPHRKSWDTLCESARLIGDALELPNGSTIVATVPPQHMYGLELSVLLPLRCGAVLDFRKPFFPGDIRDALASVGRPRVLVTTPVHIRALHAAGTDLPPLDLIVSATAPLVPALAGKTERRYGAPVVEIYGCTEAGSIASRRTACEEHWTLFTGVRLLRMGEIHSVEASYLPGQIPLNDLLDPYGERQFRLHGRMADLVNIAGKRTSLSALNHALNELEGVLDGAFFMPEEDDGRTTRLLAFAVAPGLDSGTILGRLRQRLDPVFLPRTVYLVDALPRRDSGKLPRQVLEELARRLQSSGEFPGSNGNS